MSWRISTGSHVLSQRQLPSWCTLSSVSTVQLWRTAYGCLPCRASCVPPPFRSAQTTTQSHVPKVCRRPTHVPIIPDSWTGSFAIASFESQTTPPANITQKLAPKHSYPTSTLRLVVYPREPPLVLYLPNTKWSSYIRYLIVFFTS